MKYDFDQIIDRSKNLSAKYDERKKKFGRRPLLVIRWTVPKWLWHSLMQSLCIACLHIGAMR